jgi:hypothetical protein
MPLPLAIVRILNEFRPAFQTRTWSKVVVLVVGSLLARGRRTVTVALRLTGHQDDAHFSHFHQVLNRAHWSPLELSGLLLQVLVRTFVAGGMGVMLVIDETLERRRGPHIRLLGIFRDGVRSAKTQVQLSSGLRWITLAIVVRPPWTERSWALPFLSVLAPSPKVSAQLGRRHKTVPQWARQLVALVRRWLPDVPITLLGDGAYSVVALGQACGKRDVELIAPLRFDANLFAPPPPHDPHRKGRPRGVGAKLPKLSQIFREPATRWHAAQVQWYDGRERTLEWCSGTALWYQVGTPPVAIRWLITRDPTGAHDPRAYFTTHSARAPLTIVRAFMLRWTLEVTFAESRAHLGVETQRQWSDLAIARSTPCLLGLYSLIAVWGTTRSTLPVRQAAWYHKAHATFSDVLAALRRQLWEERISSGSASDADLVVIPRSQYESLLYAACATF